MTDHKLTIDPSPSGSGFYLRDEIGWIVTYITEQLGFDLDPEALRDWIESQRPRQRYGVERDPGAVSGEAEWIVVDRGELTIAVCETRDIAERIVAALNAQEEATDD